MTGNQDDYQNLLDQKRFMNEVEQGIRAANIELIHKRIPAITRTSVLELAVTVARLRARYLSKSFKLLGEGAKKAVPDAAAIAELRQRRESYEEARQAFEALREAVEKGYVTVGAD